MRPIDGDELIVKLYQDQPMDWTGSDAEVQELNDWELFRNMVNNAPTVDAEIVVRCKDCKYSTLPSMQTQIYGKPGTLTCRNRKSPCNHKNLSSNDFCSYGEKNSEVSE